MKPTRIDGRRPFVTIETQVILVRGNSPVLRETSGGLSPERSIGSEFAKRQFRSEFRERQGNGRLYGATGQNGRIQTGLK